MPLIFLFLAFLLIYLKRKDRDFDSFSKIIFISLTFLIFINTFQIISFNQKTSNILSKSLNIEYEKNENSPDVFHLVLDMYPTNEILKSRFNFNIYNNIKVIYIPYI